MQEIAFTMQLKKGFEQEYKNVTMKFGRNFQPRFIRLVSETKPFI